MGEEDSSLPGIVVQEIEDLLGYNFRNPSLLTEALTHGSYSGDGHLSYDRLEFIGDAVLGLAVTRFLYSSNATLSSGVLTALRVANVSNEKLARVAVRHNLYRFLRRNSPDLDCKVYEFTKEVEMEGEEEEDAGALSFGGNVRSACKALADVVESTAGAVYLDCGSNIDKVWEVFRKILEPIITTDNMYEYEHPVTVLQNMFQKKGMVPKYNYATEGSSSVATATVDGVVVGTGSGTNKMTARRHAARVALKALWQGEVGLVNAAADEDGAAEEKKLCVLKLNQLCHRNNWKKPDFRIVNEQGPPHCKKFTYSVHVEVEAGSTFSACGSPESKVKAAKNSAAASMLIQLHALNPNLSGQVYNDD